MQGYKSPSVGFSCNKELLTHPTGEKAEGRKGYKGTPGFTKAATHSQFSGGPL